MPDLPSRHLLLYDAATRWNAPPLFRGAGEVIEAACNCLVDGIDSPSLRLLAGASPADQTAEVRELVEATLSELGLPAPGEMPRFKTIGPGGLLATRLPRDSIRLEVATVETEPSWGNELLVYINDVEVTRLGAGMGMDPFDILIPENRLTATTVATQVGIARCECGEYGCGATDVVILREGDAVHWDWEFEVPIRGGVTFKAEEYDAEVARIGADESWMRPEDVTARRVLEGVDRARLAGLGMRLDWATKDHADHDRFKVALSYGSTDWASDEPGYQVFLRVGQKDRTPVDVADEMLRIIESEPRDWAATWHATKQGSMSPPAIAGRRWRHAPVGPITASPAPKVRGLRRLWRR
jgi:hypothetical protein